METVFEKMERVLAAGGRVNEYVGGDLGGVEIYQLYYRVSQRYYRGSIIGSIDIANISMPDKEQNQGRFKALLARCEKIAARHGAIVVVESILNPVLLGKITKYGYTQHGDPYTFVKKP